MVNNSHVYSFQEFTILLFIVLLYSTIFIIKCHLSPTSNNLRMSVAQVMRNVMQSQQRQTAHLPQ